MKTKEPKPYLTEASLGEALKVIFPDHEFIHNKTVPESGLRTRPDYRNDDLMLIVEFDGNRHFQQSEVQSRDILKQSIYELMGYKVVCIPYFIQLSTDTIKYFFDVDIEWEQTYPHGFIDEKCVLPADFNSIGLRAMYTIFNKLVEEGYEDVVADIHTSLYEKLAVSFEKTFDTSPWNAITTVLPINAGGMTRMIEDTQFGDLLESDASGGLEEFFRYSGD